MDTGQLIAPADDVATEVDESAASTPLVTPALVAPTRATSTGLIILAVLGTIAFLYFARPVVLPVVVAIIAGVGLKPVARALSLLHLPPLASATAILCMVVAVLGVGTAYVARPASAWLNEAPEQLSEIRQRIQAVFPRLQHFNKAAAAMNDLGATEAEKRAEQKLAPTVELNDHRGTRSILSWTGTLVVGVGETLVLIFLLLASGDLFLHKLVHVMPTLSDKKRAVEISREIQLNISNYLFTVSLVNVGLGILVSSGLYFMGVPNAAMWGVLATILNFVPYFGPFAGVVLLTVVGILSFDSPWQGLLPPAWYLLLHLLEANLVTPLLLGRRFTLSPVVIFISLIFWTWLWGVPGALLSVPILVSVKVVCDRVPRLAPLGELLAS